MMATRRRRLVILVLVAAAVAAICGMLRSGSRADQNVPADKILVQKSVRRLTLLKAGKPIRIYSVALGNHPIGPKEREGDGRTPEGLYVIDGRLPHSSFHRALHVSYPNKADRARAAALRVSPGGDIMIHGIKNGFGWLGPLHRLRDWTQGCIAVTDDEIEEIWTMVKDGTPVEIVP